jgi:hypothetical protein
VTGLLLRLYPRAWRVRYGAELEELILASSSGRTSWRVRADVVAGAFRERLRSAGLSGDSPPVEQARGGVLLALCAWVLFVVGGLSVQRFSEHWQGATPAGVLRFPSLAYDAFDALLAAAVVGTVLVLVGIAVTLPAMVRFLREGGWPLVRRRILVAVASTVVAVGFVVGLALWARGVTEAGRNGGDHAYVGLAALTLAAILACLAAWTAAAVACARRLHLSLVALVVEAVLAVGVTLSMATMTVATLTWWVVFARAAQEPFFEGSLPQLVVGSGLMVVATVTGTFGSVRAVRGLR